MYLNYLEITVKDMDIYLINLEISLHIYAVAGNICKFQLFRDILNEIDMSNDFTDVFISLYLYISLAAYL